MTEVGKARRSPLFRLMEVYVLDAIGHLPGQAEADAIQLVEALFRPGSGSGRVPWRDCVTEQFGLTASVREHLVALWQQSRAAADADGLVIRPTDFATAVVHENFADTIEMLATEIVGDHLE